MGTQLQAKGLLPGEIPEDWNLTHPAEVLSVHRAYVNAGTQLVYANTFGANRIKYHGKFSLGDVIRSGVEIARKSGAKVAMDVAPTGKLLKPAGDIDFDAAYDAFAEAVQIGSAAGADLVVIETMEDVYELKAAVLAAKSVCDLPIYVTVALDANGKMLTGGSVECVATLLESLGVDAYGFNCGLGPDEMLPYVERLAKLSTRPIIAKPNAGMPRVVDGKTVFSIEPGKFAEYVERLVGAGASIVGGCCGTTPEHIEALANRLKGGSLSASRAVARRCAVSSGVETVELRPHEGIVVGERINPTGKKLLKAAYANGDTAYVLREAVRQVDDGAKILDVNCGVPGLNETELLASTVLAVQGVAACPLQIDTADSQALEGALRIINGKALVNSVNGKRESMDAVFPLVRKYGGTMVALCLDENGIPDSAEGRLAIARKILAEGEKYGFGTDDFVFDALTLAISSNDKAALVTLETVRRLTEELGVNTILGVSNVSFGLPNRQALNNAMYSLAKRAGLSAAIANPSVIRDECDSLAEDVIMGRDANCARWIASNSDVQQSTRAISATASDLHRAIVRGLGEDSRIAAESELAKGVSPMAVIQERIVPALEEVGKGFESGKVYLPQLLMAADAAGVAFSVIKRSLSATTEIGEAKSSQRPIVIATVKGDVHDIGKNIVRALLENYGFSVIDLGKDVPPERIVEVAIKTNASLVCLSALMTTTIPAMAETISQIKEKGVDCKTVVGGAVVTQEYADLIGADFYSKDAMCNVRIAEAVVRDCCQ